jgi:hypothetical protein
MNTEVIYADGSISEFKENGATMHSGPIAIHRIRLITAKSALSLYIKTEGRMELTQGGANAAVVNVIAPITGKKYKRSMNGKREALADCCAILEQIESGAVVWEES